MPRPPTSRSVGVDSIDRPGSRAIDRSRRHRAGPRAESLRPAGRPREDRPGPRVRRRRDPRPRPAGLRLKQVTTVAVRIGGERGNETSRSGGSAPPEQPASFANDASTDVAREPSPRTCGLSKFPHRETPPSFVRARPRLARAPVDVPRAGIMLRPASESGQFERRERRMERAPGRPFLGRTRRSRVPTRRRRRISAARPRSNGSRRGARFGRRRRGRGRLRRLKGRVVPFVLVRARPIVTVRYVHVGKRQANLRDRRVRVSDP